MFVGTDTYCVGVDVGVYSLVPCLLRGTLSSDSLIAMSLNNAFIITLYS